MIKRQFLLTFNELPYEKCAFHLVDGTSCEGWIMDIKEAEIEFADSGPLGIDKTHLLAIAKIDISSFYYYETAQKKWLKYPQ